MLKLEFNKGNSKSYNIKTVYDSKIYNKESYSGYLLCLYYLVSWNSYIEEKNTYKPRSKIFYF